MRIGIGNDHAAIEMKNDVVTYLKEKGMKIVETNFRSRQGEIDLIGIHQGYLVFVEVKFRQSAEKGYALEAVDIRKQRRICRVADYYRYIHKIKANVSVRYDVVGIQGEEIQWVQNEIGRASCRERV